MRRAGRNVSNWVSNTSRNVSNDLRGRLQGNNDYNPYDYGYSNSSSYYGGNGYNYGYAYAPTSTGSGDAIPTGAYGGPSAPESTDSGSMSLSEVERRIKEIQSIAQSGQTPTAAEMEELYQLQALLQSLRTGN